MQSKPFENMSVVFTHRSSNRKLTVSTAVVLTETVITKLTVSVIMLAVSITNLHCKRFEFSLLENFEADGVD